jgi:hypothetical protein
MKYIVSRSNEAGQTEYYNGSTFVAESSDAHVFTSIQDARYIQGVMQSQALNHDVKICKVTVAMTIGV